MTDTKWKIGIAALLLALSVGLVRFAQTAERNRELAGEGERADLARAPRAVLISQEMNNPYWRAVEEGAREAAERIGWNLDYEGPHRIDPEEQLRLLDKAIAGGADAVLLQGTGDLRYRELIGQAVRAGIFVVAVDTDEPFSARHAYVGTNNEAAGAEDCP